MLIGELHGYERHHLSCALVLCLTRIQLSLCTGAWSFGQLNTPRSPFLGVNNFNVGKSARRSVPSIKLSSRFSKMGKARERTECTVG